MSGKSGTYDSAVIANLDVLSGNDLITNVLAHARTILTEPANAVSPEVLVPYIDKVIGLYHSDDPQQPDLVRVARQVFADRSNHDIEIDGDARLSHGNDGIWVQGWMHLSNDVLREHGLSNPEASFNEEDDEAGENEGARESAVTLAADTVLDERLLAHLKTLRHNRRPNMHAVKDALGMDHMSDLFKSMDRLHASKLIDKRGLPVAERT